MLSNEEVTINHQFQSVPTSSIIYKLSLIGGLIALFYHLVSPIVT